MHEVSKELYDILEETLQDIIEESIDLSDKDETLETWLDRLRIYQEDDDFRKYHPDEMAEMELMTDDELLEQGEALYLIL